jgi:hypothetical protein
MASTIVRIAACGVERSTVGKLVAVSARDVRAAVQPTAIGESAMTMHETILRETHDRKKHNIVI